MAVMRKVLSAVACVLAAGGAMGVEAMEANQGTAVVLVEAESFAQRGGWVVDQQSMDQMGSPYLMAHGLGVPVADAVTTMDVKQAGTYRVWVRTRDWVGPWKAKQYADNPVMHAKGFPGRFQVVIDGKPLAVTFGTEAAQWHWQDGGTVDLAKKQIQLRLHGLTGFNGRCDAILLTRDMGFTPPSEFKAMTAWRRKLLGTEQTVDAGRYDLVVVGGGMAGICTAVSAARHDVSVALVQNRPVLGGNNSSEVRVGLSGLIRQKPYPNLGNLVDEISPVGHWTHWDAVRSPKLPRSKRVLSIIAKDRTRKLHNAAPARNYEDDKKLQAVLAEKRITLFLNTHANGVEMRDGVIAQDLKTGKRLRLRGTLFADCTGDGNLGFAAGAEFRQGRESREETGESLAPTKEDQLVMGSSMQWFASNEEQPCSFPRDLPWAVQFNEKTCQPTMKGDWNWETGADRDQATETERVRDYALRVIFGNWRVLKNHSDPKTAQRYTRAKLRWIAYIAGKRESRRLMGDVVLKQQDITKGRPFPDASVTTTWTIDLHYPKKPTCACEAFRSVAKHLKITPYPIPYRCLYSRNVGNLMMAGRNISVTHVALGTVRVQRTTGMMGEVLGMAAGLCKKHRTDPRGVYKEHLSELITLMKQGVPAPKDPAKAIYYSATAGTKGR